MKLWNLIVLLALSLLATSLLTLSGCSRSEQTAGGGIETTNGGLTVQGRIVLADGSPAKANQVKARTAWIRSDSLITQTDTNGYYSFQLPFSGHWILEANDGGGRGSVQHFWRSESEQPLNIPDMPLVGRQSMYGKILCDGAPCSAIIDLPDLGLFDLNVESVFTLHNIPRLPLRLFVRAGTERQFEGKISPLSWTDTLTINLTMGQRVLVDDFNDDNGIHELAFFSHQKSDWWILTDSISSPDLWAPACFPCVKSDLAWQGSSLFIRSDEQYNGGSLQLGIWFQQDPAQTDSAWVDLRSLESLDFYARGKGQVRMELITRNFYSQGGTAYFGAHLGLSEDWTHVVIPRSSFVIEQQSLSWDSVSSHVAGIRFVIPPETEFWLDDLSFMGMRLQDFQ